MRFKSLWPVTPLLGCILATTSLHSQTVATAEPPNVASLFSPGSATTRVVVPLEQQQFSSDLSFTVERPEKSAFPPGLAKSLYLETIRAVVLAVNPNRKAPIKMLLTLRLGQTSNEVHIAHGTQIGTLICMEKWDEILFTRLLARAVRGSIMTDSEIDELAKVALRRAHETVSVADLREQ
jgi:hypothetical protein